MFEMLPQSEGNIVGIRATGTLTDADYAELMPKLEALLVEHKRIRMLVDLGFDKRTLSRGLFGFNSLA